MTRRKDSKGRVLKDGESQRKDGLYQYRYTDFYGKRHTIYDSDIHALRKKEEDIIVARSKGTQYAFGSETIVSLVEKYLFLKRNIRPTTQRNYQSFLNTLRAEPFCRKKVKHMNVSDAKAWVVEMSLAGRSYGGIKDILGIVRPALQLAYEENRIGKNPFNFNMSQVIANNAGTKVALTPDQQQKILKFARTECTDIVYPILVFMLETGVRVGELCGITMEKLDFQKQRILIDQQYLLVDRQNVIAPPKSKSSIRCLPMTPMVQDALQQLLSIRESRIKKAPKEAKAFLLLNKDSNPYTSNAIRKMFSQLSASYKKKCSSDSFPNITPHVLRHTYCTNMMQRGLGVKALQYFMGHSTANITMDVYTHINFEMALAQLQSIGTQNCETGLEA